MKSTSIRRLLLASAVFASGIGAASAQDFNVPAGDLKLALDAYSAQTGTPLIYPAEAVRGIRTTGAKGPLSANDALSRILSGTGFGVHREGGAIAIVRQQQSEAPQITPIQVAQAAPAARAVETVTVTSSKLGGADVQSIPIAITALSQEQLTATQTAGGPDLVKQVPNLTFTKTNFTGYSIQIRGIGTQAISVATDPAVAVALNDAPFIRNHFFEQEFFDVGQVEVLRGPQGTLYGRNATAGVVNLTTAKPTDQFEAMASAEIGNFQERRFEGMINLPIVDDRLDIRLAGEWTKRDGYSFNEYSGNQIDGRNLWSGRLTIGLKPVSDLQMYLVWEHFSENDDRLRSSKQLCKNQPVPSEIGGESTGVPPGGQPNSTGVYSQAAYLSQGCEQASLYSPDSYQVPNGAILPYYMAIVNLGVFATGANPYRDTMQSPDLRVIQSQLEPSYRAKNDIVELNADWAITPQLTFTSQTAFNHDFLYSTEDFNRFISTPQIFRPGAIGFQGYPSIDENGVFCDPQLGCADRIMGMDLSEARSWQASQEFRLASHFEGPLNFSVGGNYLHYETDEKYYVFINALSVFAAGGSIGPDGQPASCLDAFGGLYQTVDPRNPRGYSYQCAYMDPNPIGSLNDKGHNYFLNENPYVLNSYALFGETYYNVTPDVKLTAGLRFTDDRKHFTLIPSEVAIGGAGYAVLGTVDQTWDQFTGRFAANWTPSLSFTDQTLVYGSYAHGYKAGGANPPGALLPNANALQPIHPLTFKPEFVDAFELGTKNTLGDGALTLNGNVFYYNYENYQISQIVDRTAINLNFDAHVKGAELEAMWEPLPGLRFNFGAGWEDTALARGSKAVDLIDRTAGDPNWVVVKPDLTLTSNCILPVYVVAEMLHSGEKFGQGSIGPGACANAYVYGFDPLTGKEYSAYPTGRYNRPTYPGFDPFSVDPNAPADVNNGLGLPPNNGAGIDKDISGNELPNAPPWTVSVGAQYSIPLSSDWAGTLRGDFYWQDSSWARVFNDDPYDRLHGYTNANLALILTNQGGWQLMAYAKNVFDTTAITGAFLNSDDTGLTTNVFLTDPRLFGVRITKNW